MKRLMRLSPVFAIALATLALGVMATPGWGNEKEAFGEADIFFELNDTDGDLGIHALIDGDPWKALKIADPV